MKGGGIESLGSERVIVLGYGLWQSSFGGDPDIIGTTLKLEGEAATVIGVAPAGFEFPQGARAWINLQPDPTQPGHFMDGITRLRPGVDIETARAELALVIEGLAEKYPAWNRNRVFVVRPLLEAIAGDIRPTLLILFGATGILLLIACANVANLLLSRSVTRVREFSLRAALGAGKLRIIQQFLTETVLLACLGAVLGLVLALLGIRALLIFGPSDLPRIDEISLDGQVLLYTLTITVLLGIASGMVPAYRLGRTDIRGVLNEGGRGSSKGPGQGKWVREALVVAELALAVMLVIGAGLLLCSYSNLCGANPGFRTDRMLTAELSLPISSYAEYSTVRDFYRDLNRGFGDVAGVEAAALASTLPLGDQLDYIYRVTIVGHPAPEPEDQPRALLRRVGPGFFRTIGCRLVRGREFEERDNRDAPGVILINEEFVRQYFMNENPIGMHILIPSASNPLFEQTIEDVEIIGIVKDMKYATLAEDPEAAIYLPYEQAPARRMTLLLRSATADPRVLIGVVRRQVSGIDKTLAIGRIDTMEQVIDDSMVRERLSMLLLMIFGIVALILATVGIYGVVSYAVVQRNGEFGIRLALGAGPQNILTLVMGKGLALVVFGLGMGLLGAWSMAQYLASQLYELSARDPLVFSTVPAILASVALAATYIPARRATEVDPIVALRAE